MTKQIVCSCGNSPVEECSCDELVCQDCFYSFLHDHELEDKRQVEMFDEYLKREYGI